jgi:methylated-DNA-protein-cysteine methyltransferase-like protein
MYSVSPEVKEKVYTLVKQVPKGMVTTYGVIGTLTHISPRVVGNALHQNNSSDTPCHRVVNRDGRLAPHFGFGGSEEQYKRLENEGVTFIDSMHVDMKKHLYSFADLAQ